jgi:SAM-dependent methyltransferase
MKIYQLKSYKDYLRFQVQSAKSHLKHMAAIERMVPNIEISFSVNGYSYPANQMVALHCDFEYGTGFPMINWRERLVCPVTGLNNRMRSSIQMADMYLNLYDNSNIYLMEQTTPMFSFYQQHYKNVVGSEFLGGSIPLGLSNEHGIRNEDGTNLSFATNTFDAILSFDVFEHIPNFKLAFSECHRVLNKGGRMLFSVPFILNSEETLIRAVIDTDGSVCHLLPPEYHGDPVNQGGILCYQHFGWEMIEDLLSAGFADAFALIFWSLEFGYYTQQIQFVAIKSDQ